MKKRLLIIVLIFAMVFGGCSNGDSDIPNQEPIALVVIAGKHANSYNFSESMLDQAAALIERAVEYSKIGSTFCAEVKLSLIVCDGEPRAEKLTLGKGSSLKTTANNKTLFKQNVDSMLDAIVDKLASDDIMAKDRGTDLQGALNQASKILKGRKESEKHILIMDTGICTEGYLDMRKLKIQDGTLDEVMARIDPSAFSDLEGVNVTFLGLGNVAKPQEDFSENTELEQRLVDFWTTYLEDGCGAIIPEEILFSYAEEGVPMSSNEELARPYPFVPTVDFSTIKPPPEILDLKPFYSAELGFEPESSEFRNAKEAIAVIGERVPALREYFENNPGKVVYIVGSIAKTAANQPVKKDSKVSLSRAQKVFDILTSPEFGFSPSNFVVIDAGSNEFSWRNNPEYINGIRQDANQEANRLVALISETDTARVQELKDKGEL